MQKHELKVYQENGATVKEFYVDGKLIERIVEVGINGVSAQAIKGL